MSVSKEMGDAIAKVKAGLEKQTPEERALLTERLQKSIADLDRRIQNREDSK
jgi:hypothetical protein